MKIKEVCAIGTVGNEVTFSNQELIILADLVTELTANLDPEAIVKPRFINLPIEVVQNMTTLLSKIVGDVKGLDETYAELFSEPKIQA
jgi:hypothetical protein